MGIIEDGHMVRVWGSQTDITERWWAERGTLEWGDGNIDDCATPSCTILDNGDGTGTVSGSHVYAQDGSYTAVVNVSDAQGSLSGGFTVTVNQNLCRAIDLDGSLAAQQTAMTAAGVTLT